MEEFCVSRFGSRSQIFNRYFSDLWLPIKISTTKMKHDQQWWILTIGGHRCRIVMRPRSLPNVLNSPSAQHCVGCPTDFEAPSGSRGTRRAPPAPIRKASTDDQAED
ncbi:hypothetical protein AVEN_179434-1 [Araneus ventricosus]|uniref:Uncharacterized protein n=1 Tax=Araneus ventricosus TaxID=182803 RepID=A0A4Y2BE21_ARAVE|nr:hypothetical protein AVEN_179434-1 [Araneus ventricosus]